MKVLFSIVLVLIFSQPIFSQVGIGTATPNEDLHVVGNVQITNGIRLGGDATDTNGSSTIGTNGQLILSDGTRSYWGSPNGVKGIVSNVYNLIGTTQISVAPTVTTAVPGLSQVITVPAGASRRLLITVLGYAIHTSGVASQGAFEVLVGGTKQSSAYVSSQNSNTGTNALNFLPTPVSFNSTIILAAGTHTVEVRYKSWSNTAQVNISTTGYGGATAADVDALKSRLTIIEYIN